MYISHHENDKNYLMDRKGSWIENLIIGMAILGGAWIVFDQIDKIVKKKLKYRCPHCNNLIDPHIERCGFCQTELDWSEIP